ncbi:MAG: 2-phospho-L-lactate transferase [Acidimicrobiales bacterium]
MRPSQTELTTQSRPVVVLAGGVGAARMIRALSGVMPASDITAIVNVGDDFCLHGLSISPDLDTITYTLAGANNDDLGWGLKGETWAAMDALQRYGGETWFGLGDRDLATHLYRSERISQGATLSQVTSEITSAWHIRQHLLPMSDDPVRTMLQSEGQLGELSFQEYFVKHRHSVPIRSVRFDGATEAAAAPGVVEAITEAERIIVAPSNPIVSIAPLLALDSLRTALEQRREDIVAVSPLIGGKALKGPADRLMRELGLTSNAVGVAELYKSWVGKIVIDEADSDSLGSIKALGVQVEATRTVMSDPGVAQSLSEVVLR